MRKPTRKTTARVLAKGQVWKANDKHIQIVELGEKILYRMQHKTGPLRKAQSTLPETMQEYLDTHEAELMEVLQECDIDPRGPGKARF